MAYTPPAVPDAPSLSSPATFEVDTSAFLAWMAALAQSGIDGDGFLLVDDIIGTVSQSGGVPTGAIIERGSNANGKYLKLADGTMFAWKRLTLTAQDITAAYGSLYRSASLLSGATALPVTFSETPTFSISAHVADYAVATLIGGTGDANNTPATVYAASGVSLTNRTIYVNVKAVGRWY